MLCCDYFEKMIDGSMSAKDAFHAFADDMKKTWAKSLADMAKQQLQNMDFGKMFSGIGSMFSGGSGGGGIMESITGMFSGGGGGGTGAPQVAQDAIQTELLDYKPFTPYRSKLSPNARLLG